MRVTKVEYFKDYKLKMRFSDKKIKIINLEDIIKKSKGLFHPLKNIELFQQVTLDDSGLSICWPNGADLCPDMLYSLGQDVNTTQRKHGNLKSRSRRSSSRKVHS
ncbi:MAG: DUF2442 domain-containing protein [Parachlamydia sp.]|nr:DUF2442 domain-containing protein [Parachlamydia sp.]